MATKPKLVVLSGAGISAESGLKTFRDSDGLWEGYSVEEVATPRAWHASPQRVLDFYNERRRHVAAAQPNAAHYGLAALEAQFRVSIITQNIDDLHERAGSTRVIHLHGEIFRMRCQTDSMLRQPIREDMSLQMLAPDGLPWRPDIVWFEEPVPLIEAAAREVALADLFLVIGTSLVVYPAAGLIHAVPEGVPMWCIDKKIPPSYAHAGIHILELPATEGIKAFIEQVRSADKD